MITVRVVMGKCAVNPASDKLNISGVLEGLDRKA
jgi:hypothetical protein